MFSFIAAARTVLRVDDRTALRAVPDGRIRPAVIHVVTGLARWLLHADTSLLFGVRAEHAG